jgi:hypothetical protein
MLDMALPPYVCDNGNSVDLILLREAPAYSWPDRKPVFFETFSFPIRCKAAVLELANECRSLPGGQAALVRERRRGIMWV